MKNRLLLTGSLFATIVANSQEERNTKVQQEKYRYRITAMMANSHIPNMDRVEGQNNFSVVPTWDLDYDFWFNNKWVFGLHNDFVMQQYKDVRRKIKQ